MNAFRNLTFVIIGILLSLTLLSCSGGGSSGGSSGGGGGGNPSATVITGHVADGFVAGATVTAYQVNANGTQGAQIGTPVLTDQSGNYTLNLGTYSGTVLITSTGGTYTDTVTGTTVDLTNSSLVLSTIVPNASGNVTAEINPLTTMAANVALTLVSQGTPVATAADAANTSIQNYFGLPLSILNTTLLDLTTVGCMTGAVQASADASMILAGISQLASDYGVSSLDLVEALIQDVTSDGLFDGLAGGATISVLLTSGTGTIPLSTMEGTALTGLANAISTFMTSSTNVCGASVDSGVISALKTNTNIFTTPDAPTGVTAISGGGNVVISWNTVSRATSYNLYMATSTGITATSTQLPGYMSIPNVTSPYVFSKGVTSTTYYFVVTAVSGTSPFVGSESVPSAEVSATVIATLPALPAQWAQTVTVGSSDSYFNSVSVAPDGSVYAAGFISGTGTYNFGNSVTAAGSYNFDNLVLVKYDSTGNALWARTVTGTGISYSVFNSVAVASDGSVFAAGYVGSGTYNLGNNVTVTGTNTGFNLVLVKYDGSGNALWAKTVTAGSSYSYFYSVAAASDGSVYAAGFIAGSGLYDFGNSITAQGAFSLYNNAVLVKYDSAGNALWAQTVTVGSDQSEFYGVTVAPDGSVYAAGFISGTGIYNFGNSVTAAGTYINRNLVLVKYDSTGNALWAQTVTAGSNYSYFNSVSVASDGSVYAAGLITGTGTYNFGNSITAAGTNADSNLVLVKYNSSGIAQWAQTVTAGSNYSLFNSVSVASDGSVYSAGFIAGTGTYNFGNSVTAAGTNANSNVVLVKYSSSGIAQWAQSVTAGSGTSSFEGVSVASDGSVCAAGYITGTGTYNFSSSVTAAGTYGGYSIVLVKYNGFGSITWSW